MILGMTAGNKLNNRQPQIFLYLLLLIPWYENQNRYIWGHPFAATACAAGIRIFTKAAIHTVQHNTLPLMKPRLFPFCFFLLPVMVYCQAGNTVGAGNNTAGGKTYAVIVGISKYANTGIPQLEFAHKDAMVFADYLKSKAGGQVPEENIRLLLNENATYAAIYDALDWLLNVCQKNDLVYFYFSGHGDMENSTIYKLGFLLSYNTPRTNYINNAVRIEDVNNIANTLSVKVNAKVVLITDACHSGKLAGSDFRGTFLVGDQLRAVQNKEIRISSCAPDQLSAEDEGWGGGRGVFSFYLVNGLEGLADANNDKTVTLNEIKSYLDSSLATDPLLAQKAMKQNPVVKGNTIFTLASVDETAFSALQKRTVSAPLLTGALKPLPPQPQAFVFSLLQQYTPEALFNFTALNKLPPDAIPMACLQMLADSIAVIASLPGNRQPDSQYFSTYKLQLLETAFRENRDAVTRFNNKLAIALSDRGQQIINNYLEGDAAELERMRYYNVKSSGYDVYPQMFLLALKLTRPENYLYQLLQVKLHYFSGVAARIKIPTVENQQPLFTQAIAEQEKAFQLEENAAYIQNELGILYLLNNNIGLAEKRLLRATQIAPKWAIPWAYLAGIYAAAKSYDKADSAVQKAISLQPDLQIAHIYRGIISEKTNHRLQAEEWYRKSIYINSRHYLPFERLGYVYMNTTQYALADSFFFEADKRKKGFHFQPPGPVIAVPFVFPMSFQPDTCTVDSADVGKNDVPGIFALGMAALNHYDTILAERWFREVIRIDKTNPLAFHYLGKLLFNQRRWPEAAIIFNLAITHHMDSVSFMRYASNLIKKLPASKSKQCIIELFVNYWYQGIDDHFYAGKLYENWNHFAEAEEQYRYVIKVQPAEMAGYYLLWQMLEKINRYNDAEAVLQHFMAADPAHAQPELADFYRRVTAALPENGAWHYRAGCFFYHISAVDPAHYPNDRKKLLPDTYAEEYVTINTAPPVSLEEKQIPGILESIHFAPPVIQPLTEGMHLLKKADQFLQQDEFALADINYKIGDLYVWQGISAKAIPYYQQSLALQQNNANTRMQLINIYDTTYQFTAAMAQLDSLYARQEIDFDKQVLMAKYDIHESRFQEAYELLLDAQQKHPYKMAAVTDLNGRVQLLSGKLKQALKYYKEYLAVNLDDAQAMYTIGRINAKLGNTSEAWTWLEKAMHKGFNYGWILRLDEVWDKYRKDARWGKLQTSFPPKKYTNTGS